MNDLTRRSFLRSSTALAGAAAMAVPAIARGAASANDRLRVAVIGMGGRGRVSHCGALHELAGQNVEIAALCDCDEKRLATAAKLCEERAGKRPATAIEYRKLLGTSRSTQ